jgi:uncharacterized protein YlxW (UPF0749 family)
MQRDEIASVVVLTLKAVLAPTQERVRTLEVTIETLARRLETLEQSHQAAVEKRLAALEAAAPHGPLGVKRSA